MWGLTYFATKRRIREAKVIPKVVRFVSSEEYN